MTTATNGFDANGTVTRAEIAYTLAQSLGLEDYANSLANDPITVNVDGETIEVEDANDIPAALRGHVQAALNLNLINVYYSITQNPFGLGFTIHAHFQPNTEISRVEFAVIVTRTFDQWVNPTQNFMVPHSDTANADFDLSVYPNPTTDRLFVKTNMLDNETSGKVTLLNNSGQVIYQNQTLLFPYGEILVNVASYPKGQYFLRLETEAGEQYTKAIVLN